MELKGFCSFHILLFTSPVEIPANIALSDPRISVLRPFFQHRKWVFKPGNSLKLWSIAFTVEPG